jgi:hypothetical protein
MYRALLVSVALLPAFASEAWAKSKPENPDRAAKKACAAGDFRTGVEILAELYVSTDDPVFIFNQGRCYEQSHQWTNAIDRFREFQRKAKDNPAALADAEKHIAECQGYLKEDVGLTAPPPQPISPPPLAAAPVPPVVIASPAAPSPAPPATHPGATLRTAGVIAASTGLAAVVTGVVLNLKANSLADQANADDDAAAESSQKSYKTGAIVCYSVGGAAVLAGTALYLIGFRKGAAEARGISLVPTWSPRQAGVALRGEF